MYSSCDFCLLWLPLDKREQPKEEKKQLLLEYLALKTWRLSWVPLSQKLETFIIHIPDGGHRHIACCRVDKPVLIENYTYNKKDHLFLPHFYTVLFTFRCLYLYNAPFPPSCWCGSWHLSVHELHEESQLLWCHAHQLQTSHLWHFTAGRTSFSKMTQKKKYPQGLDFNDNVFVMVRWRKLSLLWWWTVWGQRHCGTANSSVLWVRRTTCLCVSNCCIIHATHKVSTDKIILLY